jgi:hypothetical protein
MMLPDPAKILKAELRHRRRKLLRWAATRWWLPPCVKRKADRVMWREYFEDLLGKQTVEDLMRGVVK